MSVSGTMTKRRRRSFSPEFKAEIVELRRQPGWTVASACEEFDPLETAVRRWVHQAEVDAGVRPGVTSAEAEEVARLRKQLREVTEERDIPARAVGFFAKGTPMNARCRAFVEAEKQAGRNLAKACELLRVSRSAFYDWHQHTPAARQISDAELSERIGAIHAASVRLASDSTRLAQELGTPRPQRPLRRVRAVREAVAQGLHVHLAHAARGRGRPRPARLVAPRLARELRGPELPGGLQAEDRGSPRRAGLWPGKRRRRRRPSPMASRPRPIPVDPTPSP